VHLGAVGLGQAYENHEAVVAKVSQLDNVRRAAIREIAISEAESLGCSACPIASSDLLSSTSFHSGRHKSRISRASFVRAAPKKIMPERTWIYAITPESYGLAIEAAIDKWFWHTDWTFSVGGHEFWQDYDCAVGADCLEHGGRYWWYYCNTNYWIDDPFTDPGDAQNVIGKKTDTGSPYRVQYSFSGDDLHDDGVIYGD
jgi:hypothetical protein